MRLTCKQAHRLLAESMDREPGLVERARLRLHLHSCAACVGFGQQMRLLRQALRALPDRMAASR